MTDRSELRAFGTNLVLVIDSLLLGAMLFIFVFRRANTESWRAAWEHAPETRVPLIGALVAFVLLPVLYRGKFWAAALLLGPAAAFALGSCLRYGERMVLDTGSRAPLVAFGFFCAVFTAHALVLTVAGIAARGNPVFRRVLATQALFALLILPLVFTW
jgi:hypothetical protein